MLRSPSRPSSTVPTASLGYSKEFENVLESLQNALTELHNKDPHTYPNEMGKGLREAALRLSVLPCHYCTAERPAGDLLVSCVTCMTEKSTNYLLLWMTGY